MGTEIEAKFLDIDLDMFRETLKRAGAQLVVPERLMKRAIYDYPDGSLGAIDGWVRLRDEGDRITLSYKQQGARTLHGMQEVSLVVDDYEAAAQLLDSMGLQQKRYQENQRESWVIDGAEVELDTWPWAPSYVEIEAESEQAVRRAAQKLGLDMAQAKHGSIGVVYTTHYAVTEADVLGIDTLVFSEKPALFAAAKTHH